jgi:hypothetical protein
MEYLILESKDNLDPQVGAFIGLPPNGSRILNQLGYHPDLEALLKPVRSTALHDSQGRNLVKNTGGRSVSIDPDSWFPNIFVSRRYWRLVPIESAPRANQFSIPRL